MKKYKTFSDIEDNLKRYSITEDYKAEGYGKYYNPDTSKSEKAEGLRMVTEVYYDRHFLQGWSNMPSFEKFAAHFINAQRGRYNDEVLDILEKEFGTIEGRACIKPGYSAWFPGFQETKEFKRSILPSLTKEQKLKIRGLQ